MYRKIGDVSTDRLVFSYADKLAAQARRDRWLLPVMGFVVGVFGQLAWVSFLIEPR